MQANKHGGTRITSQYVSHPPTPLRSTTATTAAEPEPGKSEQEHGGRFRDCGDIQLDRLGGVIPLQIGSVPTGIQHIETTRPLESGIIHAKGVGREVR